MQAIISSLEAFFISMPLPFLEIWGRVAFVFGFILMLCAYGGFTFRLGSDWGFGREKIEWNINSYLAIGLTALAIAVSGYIGAEIVLVPGAQTFESLKDLFVFISILIFGYPALLAVPFAYGMSDIIEGVPVESIIEWLPGYFINPACFWIAYQFIGKCPDFRKLYTWKWYLVFVVIFLGTEPFLWGYICSGKFTPEISYHSITPALFFTTAITWIIAPFAMLIAFPLARKFGFFWAELEGQIHEFPFGQKTSVWSSGNQQIQSLNVKKQGIPVRMFLTTPLIILVLGVAGWSAYFTLKNSDMTSKKLASELHKNISENIRLRLSEDDYENKIHEAFKELDVKDNGKVLLLDNDGKILLSSGKAKEYENFDAIAANKLESKVKDLKDLNNGQLFEFETVMSKPLSHDTWIAYATRFKQDQIMLTILNENYYLADIQTGNSHAAMVFSFGLILVIVIAMVLTSIVTAPIRMMSQVTSEFARGRFDNRTLPSKLTEINLLSGAINNMADKLEAMIQRVTNSESKALFSEQRLAATIKAANLGVWEWDINNNIIFWDKRMYELFGIDESMSEELSDEWKRAIIEEDRDKTVTKVRLALESLSEYELEYRVQWQDNSIHYLRTIASILRDKKGNPTRVIGINYEVTDMRLKDKEIENLRHSSARD